MRAPITTLAARVRSGPTQTKTPPYLLASAPTKRSPLPPMEAPIVVASGRLTTVVSRAFDNIEPPMRLWSPMTYDSMNGYVEVRL